MRVDFKCRSCSFAGKVTSYRVYHEHYRVRVVSAGRVHHHSNCSCKKGPRWCWTRAKCPACAAEREGKKLLAQAKLHRAKKPVSRRVRVDAAGKRRFWPIRFE